MKSEPKTADSGRRSAVGDGASPTRTAEQLKQSSQDAREDLGRAASSAKDQVREKIEDGKRAATSAAEDTTEALDNVASDLSAQGHESLAKATSTMSAQLAELADHVGNKSLDELVRDARDLASRNPGLVIAGGLAIGFALTRFVKASPEQEAGADLLTGSAARRRHDGDARDRPEPTSV